MFSLDMSSFYCNTVYWNAGDRNAGFFNTATPDMVDCFNVPTSYVAWANADKPVWIYQPSPTTWIDDGDMTDQEKVDNPKFHTCDGYLRVNDWRAVWRKAYDGASQEDIQKVRDLPNFDAGVFEEITGLDLSGEKPCAKRVTIEGVEYDLVRGEND